MRLQSVFISVLLLCAGAAMAEPAKPAPRMLVNLLDYVASDYAGAVEGGKIKSASEYQEQLEFTQAALEQSQALQLKVAPAQIERLLGLIRGKAEPAAVAQLAQSIKADVIRQTGMTETPARWPDLTRGQKLFARNCASCHGLRGKGDGPAGVNLNPHPANLTAEEMATRSPFREFNVIREGVPGTAMVGWSSFVDSDVWDLSFYVLSLRYAGTARNAAPQASSDQLGNELTQVATLSDEELEKKGRSKEAVAQLRMRSESTSGPGGSGGSSLEIARKGLDSAVSNFEAGRIEDARQSALKAYLDGVEPVEPRLRANAPGFVPELEARMAAVRGAIESHRSLGEIQSRVSEARQALDQADQVLAVQSPSPWLTFVIAASILLREGFEAVLILIALLAVIRASGSRKAAAYVHAGWIAALMMGGAAWIFSGWLMGVSGAQREMLEGVTSVVAVAILLYMGFWLHSRTEINRWNKFINGRVRDALQGGNLLGLAAISFMAVFREALETVLFLRAVWLEAGNAGRTALATGVFGSLAALLVLSWLLVKFSAKLPIRSIFSASSAMMAALSFILAGKGVHSLQETGALGVTWLPWAPHVDLLGIFPTLETGLAQLVILIACVALWLVGRRPMSATRAAKAAVVPS